MSSSNVSTRRSKPSISNRWEPAGTSSRIESWTAGTASTRRSSTSRWSRARYPSTVVHGVKGTKVGVRWMPAARVMPTAHSKSRAVCPFARRVEDRVVDGLDGGDDEQAAGARPASSMCSGVADDVLDLDRHVVSELRKRIMQGAGHAERMRWPVEEVRVAEREVPGARRHLLPGVGQNHIHGDDAEPALVHGHHRTVPAEVLASARSLDESEGTGGAVGHREAGVPIERRQGVTQGRAKPDLRGFVDHAEGGIRLTGPEHARRARGDAARIRPR